MREDEATRVTARIGRPVRGGGDRPADARDTGGSRWRLAASRCLPDAMMLAIFLVAGVAATWPRASYITGVLPMNRLDQDQVQYVWSFWWVAHQLTHFGNPWLTRYLAAPVGVRLGYDTLMPLLGAVMAPVTLTAGPSFSYNLLVTLAPGLAAYAMYRAARLWLPGRAGPIAAGAFFGYSGMLTSQAWFHLHTAMGCVFLPLALETTVKLRRAPGQARGILAGLVIGACVLVDVEMALLAVTIAVLVLLPWLLRKPGWPQLRAVAAALVTATVLAAPQLLAMMWTGGRGGPAPPPRSNYVRYAAELPGLFAPSPRLGDYGLTGLASLYSAHTSHEQVATFGVVLSLLALTGIVVTWRRPASRKLGLLWLGTAALALGPAVCVGNHEYVPLAQTWRGVRVSLLMPYTWLVRIPLLSSFREADRLALLGLVGAALLAGAAVGWLRRRAWPLLILVAALGVLEAGWPGLGEGTVPAAMPALDRPIAADHSRSVVVDVPFMIRGPHAYGDLVAPYSLVLATADGHPRAMSISSAVPQRTIAGIRSHPFYAGIVAVEAGRAVPAVQVAAGRLDARELDVGWVLVWPPEWPHPGFRGPPKPGLPLGAVRSYLKRTGFVFSYRANGVSVYRASGTAAH